MSPVTIEAPCGCRLTREFELLGVGPEGLGQRVDFEFGWCADHDQTHKAGSGCECLMCKLSAVREEEGLEGMVKMVDGLFEEAERQ